MTYKNFIKLILILFLAGESFGLSAQTDSVTFQKGIAGIGFDFGPCTGLGFTYGVAKDVVDCDCFANVGFIYTRKELYTSIRMAGMSGELLNDISYGPQWLNGFDLNSLNFELSVGYNLLDSKRFNIIPMITGGLKQFNIRQDVGEEVTKTKYFDTYSLSTAIDIKLHSKIKKKNQYPGHEFTEQYWYLRIIGGVYPNYFKRPLSIDGGIYYLNISLGGYFKPRGIKQTPNTM